MTVPIRRPLRPAPPSDAPEGASSDRLVRVEGAALDRALARAPQADWGLAHQGAEVLLARDRSHGWLVRRAGRLLVALGRPLGPPDLAGLLRASGGRALLYKCDGRTAARARAAGWRVAPLGTEAVLDLARWSSASPACRQLRRKLRAAAAAGVSVALEPAPDLEALAAVAAGWEASQGAGGGERGFSMGRFDAALLDRQAVVVARRAGRAVAFASLFRSRAEWSLDLMRQDGAPDGTMHAVVACAVEAARAAGARRLSLAAIPDPLAPVRALAGRARRPPEGGLAQFKRSFGPREAPLYAAAPGGLGLASGLLRVGLAVCRPAPLDRAPATRRKGFEPGASSCDARQSPPAPLLRLPDSSG